MGLQIYPLHINVSRLPALLKHVWETLHLLPDLELNPPPRQWCHNRVLNDFTETQTETSRRMINWWFSNLLRWTQTDNDWIYSLSKDSLFLSWQKKTCLKTCTVTRDYKRNREVNAALSFILIENHNVSTIALGRGHSSIKAIQIYKIWIFISKFPSHINILPLNRLIFLHQDPWNLSLGKSVKTHYLEIVEKMERKFLDRPFCLDW